jgi:hypothetical protein
MNRAQMTGFGQLVVRRQEETAAYTPSVEQCPGTTWKASCI